MKRLVAWSIAAAIILSTLSPISYRPHVPMLGADVERFAAFFVVTAAFMLAYPDRRHAIAWAMAAFAIGLELVQLIVPGRHGMAHDALIKLLGVALAAVGSLLWRRLDAATDERPGHPPPT